MILICCEITEHALLESFGLERVDGEAIGAMLQEVVLGEHTACCRRVPP